VIVDHEAVLADLEAFIVSKDGRSFGQRELTDEIQRLRVKHRVPEGLVEKTLRVYGDELQEALRRRPDTDRSEGREDMAGSAPVRIGA
jgi:hypothetical protein